MTRLNRLFLALNIEAPWPDTYPKGRFLKVESRHLTLAFLGQVEKNLLLDYLKTVPPPPFNVGPVGVFQDVLFLPVRKPHVVAWKVQWIEQEVAIESWRKTLVSWLQDHHFPPFQHPGPFLPHVTIARQPFETKPWRQAFKPLPLITRELVLYESLGNLNYKPLWTKPLIPPFEVIPHTADLAFRIYGESLEALYLHAFIALSFECPLLFTLFDTTPTLHSLEDLIIALNALITIADQKFNIPFKALSFHGSICEQQGILSWDMIVDI